MPDHLTAYTADRIFTGESWVIDQAVLVENGIIQAIIPTKEIPSDLPKENYNGAFICPAFIDLQIYGAGEKLLAVFPEPDALVRLNAYCRAGGAAFCLPTVATNTYKAFYRSIDAIRQYWQQGGEAVLGLHIEGPWINPLKRGAHIDEYIHSPRAEQVHSLLEYGKGVIRMITLAPEIVSPDLVEYIHSQGIIVSAGHSNATYAEARNSFARGIRTVTHLFNAMSPLQHRAPGLAGATMDDPSVMASIIPDGHHVDFAAIRIAKAVMKERLFVITDAVTSTNAGPYLHQLASDKYESDGILSGSALNMAQAVHRLVTSGGIELGEAIRMCSLYPARLMKLDHTIGKIEEGYAAKLAVLNQQHECIGLIS